MKLMDLQEARYANMNTAEEVHKMYVAISNHFDRTSDPNNENAEIQRVSEPQRVAPYPGTPTKEPYIVTNITFQVPTETEESAIKIVKEILARYNAPYHEIGGYRIWNSEKKIHEDLWYISASYRELE